MPHLSAHEKIKNLFTERTKNLPEDVAAHYYLLQIHMQDAIEAFTRDHHECISQADMDTIIRIVCEVLHVTFSELVPEVDTLIKNSDHAYEYVLVESRTLHEERHTDAEIIQLMLQENAKHGIGGSIYCVPKGQPWNSETALKVVQITDEQAKAYQAKRNASAHNAPGNYDA